MSRLIATLAVDVDPAQRAIAAARAAAREKGVGLPRCPGPDGKVILDLDATLLTAHSEQEQATRTWKKTFGHHPLLAYIVRTGCRSR